MEQIQIDWLVVLIGTVMNVLIGFAWYSKWLFGAVWMKLSGIDERQTEVGMGWSAFYGAIASFITVFFLAFFEGHLAITTVSDGMFVGFCLWLGFVATTQIGSVIWLRKPFRLFMIDTGYRLLSFVAIGGLIGA